MNSPYAVDFNFKESNSKDKAYFPCMMHMPAPFLPTLWHPNHLPYFLKSYCSADFQFYIPSGILGTFISKLTEMNMQIV